jgi:hypothetical protein
MLLAVTVESNSKDKGDAGARMIVAEEAKGVEVSGTGSRFSYPENRIGNGRSRYIRLKVSQTKAAVLIGANAAYTTLAISLDVHPNQDATATVVSTGYTASQLRYALPYGPDNTKSWVFVSTPFKEEKILVDHTIAEIVALAA